MHEMSSSTKKLEEETSGLLRDMVRFLLSKEQLLVRKNRP